MPLILAMDTALGACSVALCEGVDVLASRFEVMPRGHAERLVPMIGEVMADAGAGFETLGAIAVTHGPGAFTGLRVGLATARGLALVRSLPVVGVTTLEAVATAMAVRITHSAPCDLVIIHDARRGEVYVQSFRLEADGVLRPLHAPGVVARTAVVAQIPDTVSHAAGSGVDLVADALAESRSGVVIVRDPCWPDARVVGLLAARRLAAGEGLAPVRPLYLRAPDARLPVLQS